MARIRDLADAEEGFLAEMLYAALFWRPGEERPPFESVLGSRGWR